MSLNRYRFIRVDEFFTGCHQWETLTTATGHTYDRSSRTLTVTFARPDGSPCVLLLTVLQRDIFRVRFNPGRRVGADYRDQNSRSVVMDTMGELTEILIRAEPFTIDAREGVDGITLVTSASDGSVFMKVVVTHQPFGIVVYGSSPGQDSAGRDNAGQDYKI